MANNKRGNPAWTKGGKSPNPAGRPKDGESWASVIKAVGEMYPGDLLEFIGRDNDLGRELAHYPPNVQMKYLVTARIFAALMFEPTSGLWKELMERAEGKVQDSLKLSGDEDKPLEIVFRYANGDTTATPTPEADQDKDGAEAP